jgi:DNA-binding transcriptional LysR family regulator
MERVSWELSILAKAIAFNNLSTAAGPVGLSQPQLSRIVSRLENELQVVLLDRTAKRKSGWTPQAHRLAEIYSKSSRLMGEQIRRLTTEGSEPQILRLGALDGLIGVATDVAQKIFEGTSVRLVELDLFDLIQLEESFSKGELDLIFSGREPGRRKFRHVRQLGFQSLEETGKSGRTRVLSPYEYGMSQASVKASLGRTSPERILVSNSLFVRRTWIESHGGRGIIPSGLRKSATGKGREEPALLVAQDTFPPRLWEKVTGWL